MAHVPRIPSRVKQEIAKYLVLKYAPEVELRMVAGGADRLHIADETDPETYLIWDPREGLTLLLHELGHWKTQAEAEEVQSVLEEEALAWGWAEQTARKENLWFDYRRADERFDTYTEYLKSNGLKRVVRIPLRVAWMYRGAS